MRLIGTLRCTGCGATHAACYPAGRDADPGLLQCPSCEACAMAPDGVQQAASLYPDVEILAALNDVLSDVQARRLSAVQMGRLS